jgi:hypothetical protein
MSLSVITAALRPDRELLIQAAKSLPLATSEPAQWIIVLDDAAPHDSEELQKCMTETLEESLITPLVLGLPFWATAGGARSIGLAQVTTRWFCILDADDFFPAGSIDLQLDVLARHPEARWCIGAGSTLHGDGTTVWCPHNLPEKVPAGMVARVTRDSGFLPTIPIAGIWDAELVRALGSWQALPRDEDTSLKLAATTAAPGVSTSKSTYVYRRDNPQQLSRASSYHQAGLWCRQAALARTLALCVANPSLADLHDGDWSAFLNG